MAIKFLQDYTTKAHPPEAFEFGQVVEDRDEASEAHFVNRGYAAYVKGGKLIDRFGKEVTLPEAIGEALGHEGEIDIARANKTQLLEIAKQEGVTLPKGDDSTVKELRAAIEAARKAQAAPTA